MFCAKDNNSTLEKTIACTFLAAVQFSFKYSMIDGFSYYGDICGVKHTSRVNRIEFAQSEQKIEHRNYIRITDINYLLV